MRRAIVLRLWAVLLCACASMQKFGDAEIVWKERESPTKKPGVQTSRPDEAALLQSVVLPLDRLLAMEYGVEAGEVNALDEVPESSWWKDPRRDPLAPGGRPKKLGPQALTHGAAAGIDAPHPPFYAVSALTIDGTLGFVVEDRRGERYRFKFDPKGHAGLVTSTELVVSRLAWASGWRVPAEYLVDVHRADLRLGARPTRKDRYNRTRPFSQVDLDYLLWLAAEQPNGAYRVVASRWLDGEYMGPFGYFDTRSDDPNDQILHDHRRSVRAFGVFAAWVNDVDIVETNTVDMYVGKAPRGHLLHYQLELGASFDQFGATFKQDWMGHDSVFDAGLVFSSFFSAGLNRRDWENANFRDHNDALRQLHPELGAFTAEHFEPDHWRPNLTNPAFARMTPRDKYWAAKHLAEFTPEELHAAIAAGMYRAEAAERLYRVLWERRSIILRSYLGNLTALDYFRLTGRRLCFDDIWKRGGLEGSATYTAVEHGSALAVESLPSDDAAGCIDIPAGKGYRVVELTARRDSDRRRPRPAEVHFVDDKKGLRIIGVFH